jgi:hypothetical protein
MPLLLLYCTMNPIDPAHGRLRALWVSRRRRRLTLFGRSAILVGCELLANAACWIVAGILFGGRESTQPILGLALLAWVCAPVLLSRPSQKITHHKLLICFPFPKTIGLRHGEYLDETWMILSLQSPSLVALDADHIR